MTTREGTRDFLFGLWLVAAAATAGATPLRDTAQRFAEAYAAGDAVVLKQLWDGDHAFDRELANALRVKCIDAETQLTYYGYRYYHASNGTWLRRDPIGERSGSNLLPQCKTTLCPISTFLA